LKDQQLDKRISLREGMFKTVAVRKDEIS